MKFLLQVTSDRNAVNVLELETFHLVIRSKNVTKISLFDNFCLLKASVQRFQRKIVNLSITYIAL